jgi:hypothetical protein
MCGTNAIDEEAKRRLTLKSDSIRRSTVRSDSTEEDGTI